MRTPIDEQLVRQVEGFRLRYCCEWCVHFDQTVSLCSLGYPAEPHRTRPLRLEHYLEFCKEFELA